MIHGPIGDKSWHIVLREELKAAAEDLDMRPLLSYHEDRFFIVFIDTDHSFLALIKFFLVFPRLFRLFLDDFSESIKFYRQLNTSRACELV